MDFSNKILTWYSQHKRNLPWRDQSDPYKVWISEIILQQTRVDQGINYFNRFVERFPDTASLAVASEDEVLKMWQGLGYYSRARNLLAGARQIMEQHKGQLPESAKQLKSIKGIGSYTAAAIASIAFNEAVPAIDGNVYRVLSRIFGIDSPIDLPEGKKIIEQLANELIPADQPGNFNQAIMEFGALQCTPAQPNCKKCIFSTQCSAFSLNKVKQLPVKARKVSISNRYLFYIVIEEKNYTYLRKRTDNDIWKNLYEFPLIETNDGQAAELVIGSESWQELFRGLELEINAISENIRHQLTHQRLHVQFIHTTLKNGKIMHPNFLKIDKRNIFEWPVPKIIENYLKAQENGY